MAKRLTESFKLQQKAYRRKMKKDFWDKSVPSFKNLDVDIRYKEDFRVLEITVTDILKLGEQSSKSKIHHISQYGSTYIISSIECPSCGRPISINQYWNCYFCECGESGKRIYEITKVEYPARKVISLPDEEEDFN